MSALGVLVALVARVWIATLRFRVHHASILSRETGPCVLAFFHGTQMMMHGISHHGRRTCVMVSHSRDGNMQAVALGLLGFHVVRGSSSRGAARALGAMVKKLREPRTDAVFAVDGPRGPYGVAKPGALMAAERARAKLIPAGAAASRAWILSRAWDAFVLPVPFSRVEIVLGEALENADTESLSRAIAECNDSARALVSAPRTRRAFA